MLDPCAEATRSVDNVWENVFYDILDTEYEQTWTDAIMTVTAVSDVNCGDWNYQFLFANGT